MICGKVRENEQIDLGQWTEHDLDMILQEASRISENGKRIDILSRHFLEVKYRENTLAGSSITPEVFVINLDALDCFTFLDYIESMRLSTSFADFKRNLVMVRYKSGKIDYINRNHFFSDWREFNKDTLQDISLQIAGEKTMTIKKILNLREDGTLYLPGLAPVERTIDYIPASAIDEFIIRKCKTGDYIGIYTDEPGLDVTHVGIIIKNKGKIYLRHASSHPEYRQVIEQDFLTYMVGKPGFFILRPRAK
jgi:hypothetical protein